MMEDTCTQNTLRATKLVRGTMEEIQYFLFKNWQSGVKFKVIHLLRDPRGKINSYLRLRKIDANIFLTEHNVSKLCQRQLKDISIRKKLEKLYPKMFMEVIYEDVASNPLDMAEEIYRFSFSESLPKSVKQWILKNTNSSGTEIIERMFNTARTNSTATSFAWRKEFNKHSLNIIERECKELIKYVKRKGKHIRNWNIGSKWWFFNPDLSTTVKGHRSFVASFNSLFQSSFNSLFQSSGPQRYMRYPSVGVPSLEFKL